MKVSSLTNPLEEMSLNGWKMRRSSLRILVSFLLYFTYVYLTYLTAMDTDKIKVFGARLKVDGTGKLAELERAERVSAYALDCSETY